MISKGEITWYTQTPLLYKFREIIELERYVDLPDTWGVLISDVVNSTKAIESGRYQTVNLLGAATVTAVYNEVDRQPIPFVFGGDGASIALPFSEFKRILPTLLDLQNVAQNYFELSLRIGFVPMTKIYEDKKSIKLARYRVDTDYDQVIFLGDGLDHAEKLIKSDNSYDLSNWVKKLNLDESKSTPTLNLTGLECRWEDMKSPYGETISLLVKAIGNSIENQLATYSMVLDKLDQILEPLDQHAPALPQQLKISIKPAVLKDEVTIKKQKKSVQFLDILPTLYQNISGKILNAFRISVGNFDGSKYLEKVSATSDYQKFDGTLRMVFHCSPEIREKIEAFLQQKYEEESLVYGIHVSDRAHLTCIVFERMGTQVHFVDGADGGYTKAALQLKKQLRK